MEKIALYSYYYGIQANKQKLFSKKLGTTYSSIYRSIYLVNIFKLNRQLFPYLESYIMFWFLFKFCATVIILK